MSKTLKYAANGALIGGLGFMLFNLIEQLSERNENPNTDFDWGRFLKAGGKGALIGGGTGAVIGGVKDISNSLEEPLNTSSILGMAIHEMKLDKTDYIYQELSKKAENITNLIKVNFKEKLGGQIVRIGSTEDNTALAEDYDIDISIPFAPKSYFSSAVMHKELFDFIEEAYEDIDLVEIRPQKKSIGLLFEIGGEELKIDIVPYKLSQGRNKTSGYLFINNDSLFQSDSYTKTDIASLKKIKLTPTQGKILLALKNWKKNFNIPISSHLMKIFLIDSFETNKGNIPRNFTDKILMVVGHLKNEILFRRIVSPENTNNILTDIEESDKRKISKACNEILDEYEYQPNTILYYFT